MQTVKNYTLELTHNADGVFGRIRYINATTNKPESSNTYSIDELFQIIDNWKNQTLLGGFAIGTVLATDAECTVIDK